MIKFLTLILFSFQICSSQDTLRTFKLVKGQKHKTINYADNIDILNNKTFNNGDSTERTINGKFLFISNDSIAVKPTYYRDVKYYDHTGSGVNDDWYKYKTFCKNQDTLMKVHLKDINIFAYNRKYFPKISRYAFYASLVTALIISPIVSIEKGGFNKNRFKTISAISGGAAFLTITFGLASMNREFLLIPTKKKKHIWTIQK